jgi:anti-sigma factor RsiW
MVQMCPDPQILSVYFDKELPAPWNEKLKAHLDVCPHCRKKLENYQAFSSGFKSPKWEEAQNRVWSHIAGAGAGKIPVRGPIWTKRVSVPLPAAAAAAALLIVVLAFAVLRGPPVSQGTQDAAFPAAADFSVTGIIPVSDINGVLQYLSDKDNGDYVILNLPESRNFSSSGEMTIIKAAEYSRRDSSR